MTQWLRPEARIGLSYLRLSGVEEDELSPDIQLKLNLKYVRDYGLDTDARIEGDRILGNDVYADTEKGLHSAFKRDNMPAWLQLIERARSDESVAAVVGYDLARVFRKVESMLEETRMLNTFGVHLILNGKIVNLKDPHDWAQWLDQAKQAEWESRITTWRLQGHYQEMRDLGIYFSHKAPFGLTRSGKRHKVQWKPNEKFPIVVRGLTLVAEGNSCARVSVMLRAEGHVWVDERGYTAPTEMTVRNWVYALDRYKPWLDEKLIYRVESEWGRRQNRRSNSKNVKHRLPFLRQLVMCEECGRRHFSRWRETKSGKDRSYYEHPQDAVCTWRGRNFRVKDVHAQFRERFGWLDRLEQRDLDEIAARLVVTPGAPTVLDTRMERDRVTLELTNLRRNYNRGDFGDTEDSTTRAWFLSEQLRLLQALDALKAIVPVETVPLTLTAVREILTDLKSVFEAQAENDWKKINTMLHTVLKGVYLRGPEIVRIAYKPEWESLLVDS